MSLAPDALNNAADWIAGVCVVLALIILAGMAIRFWRDRP
jgi:hypothetical protein